MKKQIRTDEDARLAMAAGIRVMADAVSVTLGPRGRNVMMHDEVKRTKVTKDGVTVAKSVSLPDPFEDMGIRILREAAIRCNDDTGDGTTTTVVLAGALVREGLKLVNTGMNPMNVRRGMEWACRQAVERLEAQKRTLESSELIANTARLAANGDHDIGQYIAEAYEQVGLRGAVSFEETSGRETKVDVAMGMSFDRGMITPAFILKDENPGMELKDCAILLLEEKLSAIQPLVPLLEAMKKLERPFLVLAESVEGDALSTLILNNGEGILPCCAVKAPGFGDRRIDMMQDIAILTGGTFITEDMGLSLSSITPQMLGVADLVKIGRHETVITGGWGDHDTSDNPKEDSIEGRIRIIEAEIEATESDYYRDRLRERIARLTSGLAMIRIGGHSDTEMREKKDRIEDALNAVKAALAEGVVPGGGLGLLLCGHGGLLRSDARNKVNTAPDPLVNRNDAETAEYLRKWQSDEFEQGIRIVEEALKEPMRVIAQNSGENGDHVVARVSELQSAQAGTGFNAVNRKVEEIVSKGVLDPLKVVRSALQSAVSVASLVLTAGAVIANVTEEGDEPFDPHATRYRGR